MERALRFISRRYWRYTFPLGGMVAGRYNETDVFAGRGRDAGGTSSQRPVPRILAPRGR